MKHAVGHLDEFEPGTITLISVDSRSIGVVNSGSKLYAVLNVCPHALGPICEGVLSGTMLPCEPGQPRYGLENRILRCPWHLYEFDLEDGGRSVFTTFKARLRMYPVTVEESTVFVHINVDAESRRSSAQPTLETA
jgi:nitrite reductase (NADH) small subunit